MELVSALWVKTRCGCSARKVREFRGENVRRWRPVPEDWYGKADREDQCMDSELYNVTENWRESHCEMSLKTVSNESSVQSKTSVSLYLVTLPSGRDITLCNGHCSFNIIYYNIWSFENCLCGRLQTKGCHSTERYLVYFYWSGEIIVLRDISYSFISR
jgi:hypothetical protein